MQESHLKQKQHEQQQKGMQEASQQLKQQKQFMQEVAPQSQQTQAMLDEASQYEQHQTMQYEAPTEAAENIEKKSLAMQIESPQFDQAMKKKDQQLEEQQEMQGEHSNDIRVQARRDISSFKNELF